MEIWPVVAEKSSFCWMDIADGQNLPTDLGIIRLEYTKFGQVKALDDRKDTVTPGSLYGWHMFILTDK